MDELVIKNGQLLQDEELNYSFHQNHDEKILKVYIFLPGILAGSLQVHSEKDKIKIKATVAREYRKLFASTTIQIDGSLMKPVYSGPVTSKYNRGVLEIELAIDHDAETEIQQ